MRLPATPVLAIALALAGCGPFVHRIDIQQGNAVAPEAFAKLKPGMTRAEVRSAVGTPLLTDPFHADRWDYIFRLDRRGAVAEENRFAVHFKDDKVTRIEGGPTPSAARPAPVPAAPAPAPTPAPPPAK